MEFLLCVFGMVLFIEGVPWFGFPDRMKRALEDLIRTPTPALRIMGLLLMAAGLFLVILGRS